MSTCQLDHAMGLLAATPTVVSQGRKRPLRTYSRRIVQTRAQEAKRSDGNPSAVITNLKPTDEPDRRTVAQSKSEGERLTEAECPNRGSILAYFRPVPPRTDSSLPEAPATEPVEPPPGSDFSCESRGAKSRRRLTTRPQIREAREVSKDDVEKPINDKDVNAVERAETDGGRDGSADDSDCSIPSSHDPLAEALAELPANTLGCHDSTASDSTDGGVKPKKQLHKRSAKEMTQTTLSLSLQKEPGFILCSVCDILYNPFNDKDKKEHNRRHAAASRKRRKMT